MPTLRHRVARMVERHLDEILDLSMQAFISELEVVRDATEDELRRTRASVRTAILAFLGLYAGPSSPSRGLLEEARRATVARAGEMYEREDIVTMLRIARQVVYTSAHRYAAEELDAVATAEIDAALDAFMDELERDERAIEPGLDAVRELLRSVESEDPDLA